MSDHISSTGQVFSDKERQVLAAVAEAIISQDAALALPGASDPAVMHTLLGKAAHFEARLKAGIEALIGQTDPLAIAPQELISLLDKDPRFRSFSNIMTILTMQSYYQDPRVLAVHGLAARPPFPLGHELESGDWSLLDPVKRRNPIYRPV
jgi:hypothetical protein